MVHRIASILFAFVCASVSGYNLSICSDIAGPFVGACAEGPCDPILGPADCVNNVCYCKTGFCRIPGFLQDVSYRYCVARMVGKTCHDEKGEVDNPECGHNTICYDGLCSCKWNLIYDARKRVCRPSGVSIKEAISHDPPEIDPEYFGQDWMDYEYFDSDSGIEPELYDRATIVRPLSTWMMVSVTGIIGTVMLWRRNFGGCIKDNDPYQQLSS
eukprot:gnl/MRDRNA2_/MRDRNA2_80405_c0_seq1.p1 gnl/MRDRNA2_/MRDRNA2_80405_c0~~gnl/MRDRNA2_/MRDRNA2_80405_c0_seq1.p1  ORF type:complete len:247 (+),score=24.50 gnl/MRDRNA2_/MRDRNA2_80405_c0_seq1:101-742(+)